jgi:Zn-dependent M28 family amino/carboxypeptidase
MRGDCPFSDKISLAQTAGASAIIIYNHQEGGVVFSGIAPSSTTILVFSTSYLLGQALAAETNVRLTLTLSANRANTTTFNLIADGKNGDKKRTIVIGAHLDSVIEGPGVNDNGSGTAIALTIAIAASKCGFNPTLKLRFAWWGAEELGLLGAAFYVSDLQTNNPKELSEIALNLDIDMVASPNFFYGIYAGSTAPPPIRNQSAIIEAEYQKAMKKLGVNHQPTAFDGRSDYGPFIEVGIPAGGIFAGAEEIKNATERALYGGIANAPFDPCYHLSCDTLDNVSPIALHTMLKSTAYVIQKLATSSELAEKLVRPMPFSPKPLYYPTSPKARSRM